MTLKSIVISDETHAALNKIGKRGESYSDIVDRIIKQEVK